MICELHPTEGPTTNERFCDYRLKIGDQIVGNAEVQLPGVFDPERQAILQGYTLVEECRGRRNGLSRELLSHVLEDLVQRDIHTLLAYIPYCFELIFDNGSHRYEPLWQPPVNEKTGEQEEGGFRSGKILLTPHLFDGTPFHTFLTNALLARRNGSIHVDIALQIDLRDNRPGNFEITREIEEMSKYDRIILSQQR